MAAFNSPDELNPLIWKVFTTVDDFSTNLKSAVSEADFEALAAQIPELNHQLDIAINAKDKLVAEANDLINEARNKVSRYTAQLNELMNQLDVGQAEIDTGKQKISEYQEQIESAELMLDGPIVKQFRIAMSDIKDYSSAVLTVYNNPTNAASLTLIEILGRAKYSLAALFFIVGALVCYSAMSRIIYSHMKLLGTKKALGLNKGEITRSYLMYGAAATFVGSIIGCIIGYLVIQPVVLISIKKNYVFSKDLLHFSWLEFLILFALEMVIILVSSFLACRRLLREQPVTLLAGPTPPNGKQRFFERWGIWKRLSLMTSTPTNRCLAKTVWGWIQ